MRLLHSRSCHQWVSIVTSTLQLIPAHVPSLENLSHATHYPSPPKMKITALKTTSLEVEDGPLAVGFRIA